MPALARLAISGVRNITAVTLEPGPHFNLIYGSNGSGKTSLLEAIHLLGLGRSFRSHLQKPLISHDMLEATVFGETSSGVGLGLQRPLRGPQTIRIAGKAADGLAQLSRTLPLQIIHADTFQLLEGSPGERRRFLDWGVFHVEQAFLDCWRRARTALEQRNQLLRSDAPDAEIEPWSRELALSAEQMHQCRQRYLARFTAVLREQLEQICAPTGLPVDVYYWRGWAEDGELLSLLQETLPRDRKYGHTTVGPHKADLVITVAGRPVAEVFSRGQLKVLICALKIAQSMHLEQEKEQVPLFLLDDLSAELDSDNRAKVCGLLAGLGAQVFLTSIEQEMLAPIALKQANSKGLEMRQFHVKHGKIDAV